MAYACKPHRSIGNGFSTLELTAALAIGLVMAGIAIPNIMTAVQAMRLRSSAASTAGLLQEMRLRAVSDDRHYALAGSTVAGANVLYADLNSNNAFDSTEPVVQLGAGVAAASGSTPSIDTMSLGFTPQPAGTQVSFNARGVPCVGAGSSCKTISSGNVVGFVYFLSGRASSSTSWMAITISPSGRIKTWSWNGAKWRQG